jgi:hypothetical protein
MLMQRSIGGVLLAAALALVVSHPASAQTDTGKNLPPNWKARDIGNPGAVGSTVVDNGVWTIKGAGADLWGTENDDFQFASTPVKGDGVIIARYLSAEGGHETWIKNGVMIRENDTRGSPMVITEMRSVGSGLSWHWRQSQDGEDYGDIGAIPGYDAGKFPITMMTQRSGDTFSGFLSYDGKFFTQVGTRTFKMAETASFGLCVMSHIDGELMTAKFDNVRVIPGATALTGGRGAVIDKLGVFVWDPGKNAVGYNVYRGPDADHVVAVNQTPITDTFYVDMADGGGLNKLVYGVAGIFNVNGQNVEGPAIRLW